MPKHGNELHWIRPDRVYGTGVLTSIPGFNPVQNAQEVAARFTAIWQPRVTDAPAAGQAAGVTAQASAPAPTPAAPTTAAGTAGMGGALGGLRGWWYRRKLKKALSGYRGRQISGAFGAPRDPSGEKYGALPVVGGYAPAFQNQADVGLAITSNAMSVRPMPPTFLPQAAAAAGISPFALANEALSQQLVAGGNLAGARLGASYLPPSIAARANGAVMENINTNYRAPWPWWGRR